jgi:hypothetical protein
MVAGATDPGYCQGLKARSGFLVTVSDLPPLLAELSSIWRAVFITRRQVDEIYGTPRTRLGYLGRRLARPFDLALRYVRSLRTRRARAE